MAVAPDGGVYFTPLTSGPGSGWIYKLNESTGSLDLWATCPFAPPHAFTIPAGLAISSRGMAFSGEVNDRVLYSHVTSLQPGVPSGDVRPAAKRVLERRGNRI